MKPRIAGSLFAVTVSLSTAMCVGDSPSETPGLVRDASAASTDSAQSSSGSQTPPDECAARVAQEATGVFVSVNGADSDTCGTPALPCQLVNTGIARAALLKKDTVYLARGTYIEAVRLASGITLDGGWDPVADVWNPVCGSDRVAATRLALAATSSKVVEAQLARATTLRSLTVETKRVAAPGETLYGIFAVGSQLVLDAVVVTVGSGGAGQDGAAGADGDAGAIKCAAGVGGDGTPGAVSALAVSGVFGEAGYTASDGQQGQPATAGEAGPCATQGQCTTTCNPGSPAAQCTSGCIHPISGCGGEAGLAGQAGLGGGSSIAMFGWSSELVARNSALSTADGGKGGEGGAGGAGGAGGTTFSEQLLCVDCSGTGCATVGNQTLATGAAGGKGGNGGAGSGGAGGSSYAVYSGGPGATYSGESTTLSNGAPGAGGGTSPAGQAAPLFPL